jgi:hypothetical protein
METLRDFMPSAYFLEGSENEYILVVRSFDKEKIEKIIQALKVYKDKDVDAIVEQLEESLNEQRKLSSKPRSKDKGPAKTSPGRKNREAANGKSRSQHRS